MKKFTCNIEFLHPIKSSLPMFKTMMDVLNWVQNVPNVTIDPILPLNVYTAERLALWYQKCS